MERKDAVVRWTGPVIHGWALAENLPLRVDEHWMEVVARWLQSHGGLGELQPIPIRRGVRGLTPERGPHPLRALAAMAQRAW